MRVLTRYCIVNFNPLEIKILYEAFKDFNPRRYDVEESDVKIIKKMPSKKQSLKRIKKLRHQAEHPTRDQYNGLRDDFDKYILYTKSSRFFNALSDYPTIDSFGKDVPVRLWDKDPEILVDIITNYLKVESIEPIPKNLIENKSMMTIYKHHVTDLLKDLKQIHQAMKVRRIQEMDYD